MQRNNLGQFTKEYSVDENFFEKINTEEKAYILGFFYADGYNYNTKNKFISCCQLEQDINILEKIKIALKSNHNFIKEVQTSNNKIKYKLTIYNEKLSDDLQKLGCIQNKSLVLQFPNETIVPKELMRHFIRGYFDGDGCIWEGKPKISTYISKKSGNPINRFIHNLKFTFTGCYSFIDKLQDYFVESLGFKKTKLNFSNAKNPNKSTSENVCTMEYSGKNQINKLFNFLYKDSTIYGDRKYNKFLKILCADSKKLLYETRLTAEKPLEI